MSTRCRIDIKDSKYINRIYRHADGYPEGVIADLYIFMKNYSRKPDEDPEYFLANFIFYVKLTWWIECIRDGATTSKMWEYGYGVCAPNCNHGDLEYAYTIEGQNVKIEKWNYSARCWETIFKGSIDEAYKKFCANTEYRDGCHISQYVFDIHKILSVV